MYDVAIAGAGPAGATASKILAEKGFQVALIDKQKFPRDKPCGGGLSLKIFERFPYLKKNTTFDKFPIFDFVLFLEKEEKLTHEEKSPLGFTIRREEFDNYLFLRTKDAGTVYFEKRVKDIRITSDFVEVFLRDQNSIKAKMLIGADGVNSIVANKTGLNPKWNPDRVALLIVKEFFVGKDLISNSIGPKTFFYWLFNKIRGYGWVFPKKEHVNVGLGEMLSTTRNLKRSFFEYVDFLKKSGIIPKDLDPRGYKAALVPIRGPLSKVYADRVLLAGDAAGFVYPFSGEGIYFAMVSGEIAADVLITALETDNFSEKILSRYQKLCKKDFGEEMKFGKLLQDRYTYYQKINDFKKLMNMAIIDEKMKKLIIDCFLLNHPTKKIKKDLFLRYPIARIKSIIRSF